MAQFTGSGKLTLNGPDSRFYDFECANTGGFEMNGNRQRMFGCYMQTDITLLTSSQQCIIEGNVIAAEITLEGNNDFTTIVGNFLNPASAGG